MLALVAALLLGQVSATGARPPATRMQATQGASADGGVAWVVECPTCGGGGGGSASSGLVYIVDAGPALNLNPVAIASLPLVFIADAGVLNVNLPPGAAMSTKQDTANASLANLDVALSTRTKPADQQHVIIDSSAGIAVTLATAPSTPITAAALPLPAGAATDATLSQLLDGGVALLSSIAANQAGVQRVQVTFIAQPLNPFLPRCNPVRRTGCQP